MLRAKKKFAAAPSARRDKAAAVTLRAKTPAPARKRPVVRSRAAAEPFPIVCIGASAGGLEALEQFFSAVPAYCGMAFVVIQHLDPTRKGVLPELLARGTALPVVEAADRMPLAPGAVYVIPPNKDLSILRGRLHLLERAPPGILSLPIDFFMLALAQEQHERSAGVILSGMGSDGLLGARAIKAQGGLVLAQEPRSAKFDSMPGSVINAGLADIVAPAAELAARLIAYFGHIAPGGAGHIARDPAGFEHGSGLDNILILLRDHSGSDFSLYKKSTLYRRIERRMALHRIAGVPLYVRYLRENPQELDLLLKELLIGVTAFFRDAAAWQDLQSLVLAPLLAAPKGLMKQGKPHTLRAWVAGCSTGEEAYTLAILLHEALEPPALAAPLVPLQRFAVQIFASDISADAIAHARHGLYPANIAAQMTPARLARFFVKEADGYRVAKALRDMVVFATHDLMQDAPFIRLDILCCRNVLIYFTAELQTRLLPLFHYSLNSGGALFLGSAESLGSHGGLFDTLPGQSRVSRLFRSRRGARRELVVAFPDRQHLPLLRLGAGVDVAAVKTLPAANLRGLADDALLSLFAPPAVLVDAAGDILYLSGRTGDYLEAAAGRANWNIHAMARNGLRQALALALHSALRSKKTVTLQGIKISGRTGDTDRSVDITLRRLDEPPVLRDRVMIVFSDAPPLLQPLAKPQPRGAVATTRLADMARELRQARDHLHDFTQEMQTFKEDLKSANEEMQSANEELQSTNEELSTSKEEMQSLNEELQTVNAELQGKMDDLSVANSDLRNLLNSADIAIIFLDGALRVRRFTTQATRIFKLLPGDAGRPLSDIVSDLHYPSLQADAQEVLRSLAFSEKQIAATGGRWFLTRIMPYRTVDNVIDGVVITFSDISVAKQLEAELRKVRQTVEFSGQDKS